jgi:tRNA nucleotidyltransferase (CCA-adding enzyme)
MESGPARQPLNPYKKAKRGRFRGLSCIKNALGVLTISQGNLNRGQIMFIKIPEDVKHIMRKLSDAGYEAFVVGGCVRDSLLGFTPKDWDIATNATPDKMKKVFSSYKVIPTGEQYGTLTVLRGKTRCEVTAYRSDGAYSDGRRPDTVTFSQMLGDDIGRRDFTINAIAYNEIDGLTDFFDGQNDLSNRTIRCVGDPAKRFNEDALRIMRAIRFAVALDFDISKETVEAIWTYGKNLDNISQERKRDELLKTLKGLHKLKKDTPHYTKLRLLTEYVIKRVIPEFQTLAQVTHNSHYHYTDIFTHTMDMLFMADTDDTEILLTVLFHDIGKMEARVFDEKQLTNHYPNHAEHSVEIAQKILTRMRFDNKTIKNVLPLVSAHDYVIQNERKCAKKLLNLLGMELCGKLLRFQMLDKAAHRWNQQGDYALWAGEADKIRNYWREIIDNNEAFNISGLSINGGDLIAIGYKQGRIIGEILNDCLEYVMENPEKNNKQELIEYISVQNADDNGSNCQRKLSGRRNKFAAFHSI